MIYLMFPSQHKRVLRFSCIYLTAKPEIILNSYRFLKPCPYISVKSNIEFYLICYYKCINVLVVQKLVTGAYKGKMLTEYGKLKPPLIITDSFQRIMSRMYTHFPDVYIGLPALSGTYVETNRR